MDSPSVLCHLLVITIFVYTCPRSVISYVLNFNLSLFSSVGKVLSRPESCCGLQQDQVLNIAKHICTGVEYLHSMRIIHRDLKPENIVLQEDEHGQVRRVHFLGEMYGRAYIMQSYLLMIKIYVARCLRMSVVTHFSQIYKFLYGFFQQNLSHFEIVKA